MKNLFDPTFLKYLLTQKRRVLACVAVFVGQALMITIVPLPLSFAIDHVLAPKPDHPTKPFLQDILNYLGPTQSLVAVVLAMVVVCIIAISLDLLENVFLTKASNILSEGLKKEMFRKIMRSQKAYVDQAHSADIIGRLSQDTLNIQVLFQTGLPLIVRSIPSLLMIIAILFTVNPLVALGMSAVAVLMFVNTFYFTELARERRRIVRKEMTEYEDKGYQALNNFMLIKLMHRETATSKKMARVSRRISTALFCANWFETLMMASMDTIKNSLRILILLIGGIAVLRGDFTVGGIMMITSYVNSIAASMNDLTKFSYKSARAFASLDRIKDLLGQAEKFDDPKGNEVLPKEGPISIAFENVSFEYAAGEGQLRNFNLNLQSGQVVAVVGPSGIGKSTMFNLISRIVRPQQGQILVNGRNINNVRAEDLYNMVTYVPQRTFFMKDTIRANLQMSVRRPVVAEKMWTAMKRAHADGFVGELDQQLETVIGDSGKAISGGQSRRLALSRGFLRDPNGIFLFDEPTDSLDPISRGAVLQTIGEMGSEGALVIYSTHRHEEIAIADTVIEFHGEGRVTVRSNREGKTIPFSRESLGAPSLRG